MNEYYLKIIDNLIKFGYLKTTNVINSFKNVDIINFVSSGSPKGAYKDRPMYIGHGQNMPSLSISAFMLELLDVRSGNNILEVGTGSGWQTIVLANILSSMDGKEDFKIISIEKIKEIYDIAVNNIKRYKYFDKNKIILINKDGLSGEEKYSPYDRIISSVPNDNISKSWKNQLKIGGKMVVLCNKSIFYIEKVGKDNFFSKEFPGFF